MEGKRGPAGPPGATGAQGAPGAKGDQGAPATRLWAVVNVSGTTGRGSGVTGSAKVGTGQYEVVFNRDVTTCSYQATMSVSAGEVVAQAAQPGVPNGVFVGTFTSAGRRRPTGPSTWRCSAELSYSLACASDARRVTFTEYFDGWRLTVGLSISLRRPISLIHWLGLSTALTCLAAFEFVP